MAVDKSLRNVCVLGLAFMLVFTTFHAMGSIQKTFIDSAKEEDPDFSGNSNITFIIIIIIMSILIWGVPSLISVIGPKIVILIGGVTYIFFTLTFLLPKIPLLYLACVILGSGAAAIWPGMGKYFSLNSSAATISRNSGIFWSLYSVSGLVESIVIHFAFKGQETIDIQTRNIVAGALGAIGIVGIVVMALLPKPQKPEDAQHEPDEIKKGPYDTFKATVRLFFTKNMLLLSITSIYTGFNFVFFSSVYSDSVLATKNFENSIELQGYSRILITAGDVLGGAFCGILGAKTVKCGRYPIVIGGFIVHIVAFVSILLNLPNPSPVDFTSENAIIKSSRILVMVCAFLSGLGDACFHTQMISMLGREFSDNSAGAFGIYKFVESLSTLICYQYSTTTYLYVQLGILLFMAVLGTLTLVYLEYRVRKAATAKADTNTGK